MSGDRYWVTISRNGTRLGAGFLLVGWYVLTAHHCLGRAGSETDDVTIEFEGGEMLPGRVHRRSPRADLALIDILKPDDSPMVSRVVPHVDRAKAGDAWRNPYQPGDRAAKLSGTIDAFPIAYRCEGEDLIEAMQLRCDQDLKGYTGYSGSPIEGGRTDEDRKLLGVLIEQYPEHYPYDARQRPASKVLFAATISEVLSRFDCFHTDHLISLLPSSPGLNVAELPEERRMPVAHDSALNEIHFRMAAAEANVEWLDGLFKRGLLDEQNVTALKLQVINRYLFGDDGGEPQ